LAPAEGGHGRLPLSELEEVNEPEEMPVVDVEPDDVGIVSLGEADSLLMKGDGAGPACLHVVGQSATAVAEAAVHPGHPLQLAELLGEDVALLVVFEGAIEIHLVVEIPAGLEVDLGQAPEVLEAFREDLGLLEDPTAHVVAAQGP